MFRATEGRWGSREIEITAVDLVGPEGVAHIFHTGDQIAVRMRVRAHRPVADFVFGFGLFSADGVCCYGTNTHLEGFVSRGIEGEEEVTLQFDRLDLVAGTYKIDVAVHRRDGATFDYQRLLHTFRIKSRSEEVGLYRPPHAWTFTDGIRIDREDRE